MPRPARRRGGDGAAAGVSSDKVSVLTMVNARGDAMAVAAHRRFASSGPRAPLNRVNALHSALKAFLARFRGASTRRLPN